MARVYRIGIGGIFLEGSTFGRHQSTRDQFAVATGAALLARHGITAGTFWADDIELVPLVHFEAWPGGPIPAADYQSMKAELLNLTRAAGHLDGYILDVHGAASVVGIEDAEADLAASVRKIVGPDALIGAPMDPHGNVSLAFAKLVDVPSSHRTSPHVDMEFTRERVIAVLAHCLRANIKPVRAWVQVPTLLPGEAASTRTSPAKELYESLVGHSARDGILEAAYWIGYAWADQARCTSAVVVTGVDKRAVTQSASELAQSWWSARFGFGFESPSGPLEQFLLEAADTTELPFIISDSGDNPTAGGDGNSAYALQAVLSTPQLSDSGRPILVSLIADPAAANAYLAAGVGSTVTVELGDHAGPKTTVKAPAKVKAIVTDDPWAGVLCLVSFGQVDVVVSARRAPFHERSQFRQLGIDPADYPIMIVKLGYLEPELHEIAAANRLALTPGAVDQDICSLDYENVERPIFGLDEVVPGPRAPILLGR